MGKLIKKNTTGAVRNFMTRNQALKKLQISLVDFRRLCIIKGIYPRDPKYRRKLTGGSSAITTFYHTKDILHILHEPLLVKLREYQAFAKKLRKFIGKNEWATAKKFEQNKPVYTLDHIVKERYPTFQDALRDLDDTLCHLFLFASLPRVNGYTERISKQCTQLCHEFMHYVMASHGLRKAFLSIKGIYYQAEVCGQTITWLTPYEFSQYVPPNVDFRVMLTFLEFYQSLMGFVNYKLLTDLDFCYPPTVDAKLEMDGSALMSLRLESKRSTALAAPLPANSTPSSAPSAVSKHVGLEMATKIKELEAKMPLIVSHDQQAQAQLASAGHPVPSEAADSTNVLDAFPENETQGTNSLDAMQGVGASQIQEKSRDLQIIKTLFSDFVIFLSREVPCDALIFAIRCFGGRVGWAHTASGSPFAENDPRITHQISDRPVQAALYTGRVYVQPQWIFDCLNQRKILKAELYAPGATLPPHYSPFVAESEDPSALNGEPEEEDELSLAQTLTEVEKSMARKSYDNEYKQQLEAEAKGVSFSSYQEEAVKEPSVNVSKRTLKQLEAQDMENEQKEMALSMMSKKKRKLYEAMQRGIHNKKMEADRLKMRRIQASKQTKQSK